LGTAETGVIVGASFPLKLDFLLTEHWRYKVLYGGRHGLKSWNIAQALLILASREPLRILCTRETQSSLGESVHATLSDWVKRLKLEAFFTVYQTTESGIMGKNGSSFLFKGLKEIDSIKSAEGIDVCWVEEAQTVTEEHWKKLTPTIRKQGSEIWVSFNPELETDATYRRFVVSPPPNCKAIETNWRDALSLGWLTDDVLVDIYHARDTEYQTFLNVYEGQTKSAVSGAVYGEEMRELDSSGRVTQVVHDRNRPVDVAFDLGFFDTMALWFFQAMPSGIVRIVDYAEARQKPIEWWVIQLQQRGYAIGTLWLPWDGVDALTHRRLTGDRSKSPEQIFRAAGYKVRISPKLAKVHTISAVRAVLPNCYFDQERCREGLRALRSYQWGIELDDEGRVKGGGLEKREPLHDWASHGSSAFGTLAVTVKYPEAPERPNTQHFHWPTGGAKGGGTGWMNM
jgi:phage terminase large subunit